MQVILYENTMYPTEWGETGVSSLDTLNFHLKRNGADSILNSEDLFSKLFWIAYKKAVPYQAISYFQYCHFSDYTDNTLLITWIPRIEPEINGIQDRLISCINRVRVFAKEKFDKKEPFTISKDNPAFIQQNDPHYDQIKKYLNTTLPTCFLTLGCKVVDSEQTFTVQSWPTPCPIHLIEIPPSDPAKELMLPYLGDKGHLYVSLVANDGSELEVHLSQFIQYSGGALPSFLNRGVESETKKINLPFSKKTIGYFVDFLYSSHKKFEDKFSASDREVDITELLLLAHTYQIQPLLDIIINFIIKDVQDLETLKWLTECCPENQHLKMLYMHYLVKDPAMPFLGKWLKLKRENSPEEIGLVFACRKRESLLTISLMLNNLKKDAESFDLEEKAFMSGKFSLFFGSDDIEIFESPPPGLPKATLDSIEKSVVEMRTSFSQTKKDYSFCTDGAFISSGRS